ncbi:FliM/FliN family flagellar motor C-terminal domain-containing protein [uncultured Roseovarius sp.]|uniref:FliM/FliN family flagellar motor C-terminal domain-containing protein n=1 Tax=uncultured Roseovarius sp. TaxID=293344 RepID=UPI00261E7443|nr:FliM/FliN family flagellar motor C-terminal domain-containing protein [uncultured Roseovarius sp.]
MGSQDHSSIIQRKAKAARDGFESREMTPAKALRLSLAREADALFDLAMTVVTIEQTRVGLADISGALSEQGLLVLLDGAGAARGALCLDTQFLAALIEVQTTGAVHPGVARPRVPTRTDAAMVAPLIDAVLAGVDAQMRDAVAGYRPRGFSFGDMVEDTRALALLLLAPEFDVLRLNVDLGPGIKTGRLDVLLPVDISPRIPTDDATVAGDGPVGLGNVVINAPLVLDAAMARLRIPLRDVWAFKIGDLVPVPREAIGETELLGPKGHLVATARLGQMNGWRALRLIAGGAGPLPDGARADTRGADGPVPSPSTVSPVSPLDAPIDPPSPDVTNSHASPSRAEITTYSAPPDMREPV